MKDCHTNIDNEKCKEDREKKTNEYENNMRNRRSTIKKKWQNWKSVTTSQFFTPLCVCVHFLSRSQEEALFLSEVASVISPFDWLCAKDGSKCRLKKKPRSRKSKASKHKKRHVVRKKFVLYFLYDAVLYIFFQIIVCASECAVPSIWQTEPRALLRTLKETACSLYFVSIFTTHEWNVLGIAIVSCSSYYCYYYLFCCCHCQCCCCWYCWYSILQE